MSRHAELNGADQEPLHWQDTTCDYCARTIYDGSLRPQQHGGSIAWLCGRCRDLDAERYERMAS